MRSAFVLVALAGCGRIAFDPLGDGGLEPTIDVPMLGVWSPPTLVPLPTLGVDDDPTLTADMLELTFNRGGVEIWTSRRTAVGQPWSPPVRDAVLSGMAANTVPELAGDGLTIYFASTRGGGSSDIYQATRLQRTDPWGVPVVQTPLNTGNDEFGGSTTADGLLMTLSNDLGANADVLASTRATTASPWSAPVRLPGLDTAGPEDEPFISLDGLTLYYSGPTIDLFVSQRAQRSDPFAVGTAIPELNSTSADRDPWVSLDGHTMYFSSDRGGTFALWESTR